jgi:hypothetical protein
MASIPSERVAMLVVRAWLRTPDDRLFVRITQTSDVLDGRFTTTVVGSADELYAAVRRWLESLQASGGGPEDTVDTQNGT